MEGRSIRRARDVVDAVDKIEQLLDNRTLADLHADPFLQAAFERFLEIVSEASRHIPAELKDATPDVPWRRVADIGTHLRHAYHKVDAELLWLLYVDGELTRLKTVAAEFAAGLEGRLDK